MKTTAAAFTLALSALSAVSALPTNMTAPVVRRQCAPAPPTTTPAPAPSDPAPSDPAPPPPSGGGSTSGAQYTVYADAWLSDQNFPTAADIDGYTAFYLAFWMSKQRADNAQSWESMDAATRQKLKDGMTANGAKLMVSAFGATEFPTTGGVDPVGAAQSLAQWVKDYGMDGVDVDYEDLDSFNNGSGAEDWLISFTKALRDALPSPFIITHAPLAPWFQPGEKWKGGGYLKVHQAVGDLIDWYNMQFYNQGEGVYTDCAGLMEKSADAWPGTSVMEMIANGVDGAKIVVGKPATNADASNGFMDPGPLGQCLKQYVGKNGFTGGAMTWQWNHAGKDWVSAVKNA
ncbi:glycoside hydrolase [Auricularia subglabra TFB-10046 SS5]|nr:glycoside hydrolase [Auricularia subglabra TFB-10046 SS5]